MSVSDLKVLQSANVTVYGIWKSSSVGIDIA